MPCHYYVSNKQYKADCEEYEQDFNEFMAMYWTEERQKEAEEAEKNEEDNLKKFNKIFEEERQEPDYKQPEPQIWQTAYIIHVERSEDDDEDDEFFNTEEEQYIFNTCDRAEALANDYLSITAF